MNRGRGPATIVLVSHRSTRRGHGEQAVGRVPISWVSAPAVDAGDPAVADEVLELPPSCADSRQAVRDIVREARRWRPALCAVRVPAVSPRQRGVLAEVGIRVAVVDHFADAETGTRRPAPRGWPCRSFVWGLWEVQVASVTRGWRRLVGSSPFPGTPAGGLVVVVADDDRQPLGGCVAWAERARARGIARIVTVTDLPRSIEQGGVEFEAAARSGSVLHAA